MIKRLLFFCRLQLIWYSLAWTECWVVIMISISLSTTLSSHPLMTPPSSMLMRAAVSASPGRERHWPWRKTPCLSLWVALATVQNTSHTSWRGTSVSSRRHTSVITRQTRKKNKESLTFVKITGKVTIIMYWNQNTPRISFQQVHSFNE